MRNEVYEAEMDNVSFMRGIPRTAAVFYFFSSFFHGNEEGPV